MIDHPLRVRTATWGAFEAACHTLTGEDGDRLHPDDVISSKVVPQVTHDTAGALLPRVLEEVPEDVEEDELMQLAQAAGALFFTEAIEAASRGTQRAKNYAERAAVWDRMQGGTGVPPSLSRVLARYDAGDYERLRQMPLEEMICYLLLQSANAASDKISEAAGRNQGLR